MTQSNTPKASPALSGGEPTNPAYLALKEVSDWDHRGDSVADRFDELHGVGAWAGAMSNAALSPAQAEPQHQPAPAGVANLVPGKVRCARCDFSLLRSNLNVHSGTVTAGDSKTEPCPNGCGPLWPVTWEQEARETWKVFESMFDRAKAAEDALEAIRNAGPSLVALSHPQAEPLGQAGAYERIGYIHEGDKFIYPTRGKPSDKPVYIRVGLPPAPTQEHK